MIYTFFYCAQEIYFVKTQSRHKIKEVFKFPDQRINLNYLANTIGLTNINIRVKWV